MVRSDDDSYPTSSGPPIIVPSSSSSSIPSTTSTTSTTSTATPYDPLVLGPIDTHVPSIKNDTGTSVHTTSNTVSSASLNRPQPPPLPPRPSFTIIGAPIATVTLEERHSTTSRPFGLIVDPVQALHDDFWDSARLAARDRVLLDEAHKKNLQRELELEQSRIVPGMDNADLLALVKAFDKVSHTQPFPI